MAHAVARPEALFEGAQVPAASPHPPYRNLPGVDTSGVTSRRQLNAHVERRDAEERAGVHDEAP